MMKTTYCVVYRTGGTANFQWHRTIAMSKEAAQECAVDNRKMGYPSMVVNYQQSLTIGLPETYSISEEVTT